MVNSVLKQTYSRWELLTVDDVSTDGTEKLMLDFNKLDPRIKYFRIAKNNSLGISKYLNYGINIASGKYISRLDDDDYWFDENTLKLQVEFLDTHTEYLIVGGGVIIIDEKNDELFRYYKKEKNDDIRKNALIANPFAHNTVMFRKDNILSLGGYRNIVYLEDWDLWLRIGKIGKFYNFQKYFTCYLSAGQNNSFIKQRPQTKAILEIISKYKHDYPNFKKGYILNFIQYLYTLLPVCFRKRFHSFMVYIKRKYF
jgi:glycosyltransferase involved in cell wall biosynthesis